jgi:transposase
MAMGRWRGERQGTLFIETEKLARSEGRTFYSALSEILSGNGFDRFCEEKVAAEKVFDEEMGRPSIPPGVYFRMLLVGYFEGVASERGIAWRCADSLSLREFLGYELTETTPDHSTLSGLRRKLGLPLHRAVFDWVLDVAAREGILKGRRVAVDSTMLQANASMKAIVRRCDGVSYRKYLEKLAKAEHAVDVDSGVTVAAEVHGADQGDPATMAITASQADEAVMRVGISGGMTEVVADRGYHADEVIEKLQTMGLRTSIAEKKQKRNWKAVAQRVGQEKMLRLRQAFRRNHRRVRSAAGRALQKLRAEYPERSFAHVCNTEGFRRVFVRGKKNVAKRLQIHVAAANLGIVLRKLFGVGTPRGLQGRLAALLALFSALILAFRRFWGTQRPLRRHSVAERPLLVVYSPIPFAAVHSDPLARFSTGC